MSRPIRRGLKRPRHVMLRVVPQGADLRKRGVGHVGSAVHSEVVLDALRTLRTRSRRPPHRRIATYLLTGVLGDRPKGSMREPAVFG
jgi:hypothetical protein